MVMTSGWSLWISVIVIAHIIGYAVLLFVTSKIKQEDQKQGETTGHEWNGIAEYNNPLPRWWLYMFILTIVFAVVYLVLYPGMGNYLGSHQWTQEKAWAEENAKIKANRDALFSTFIDKQIPEMIKDAKAMQIGERMFANHCSACHGSDAQGAVGFPNLTDNDWLYGGEPASIEKSIAQGRMGVMPPWGAALGEEGVKQVAAYVREFSEKGQDKVLVEQGQQKFAMFCAACHGADGTGQYAVGAPNLTDTIWLHSYDSSIIEKALMQGLSGKMPKHSELLDDNSIKVLAAYVYSLTNK